MAESGGGDPGAYVPPLSLWQLVEQHVSPEEQDEIKSMLGISLVENTLDLHREVQTLLEIWQDYQEEATVERERVNALPSLAEPPHQRERLVQEICFLAQSVREKSTSKGMNPSEVLSRHNSQVLDYAEGSMRCGSSLGSSQPQSACSSDGRQTPRVSSDRANSRSALDCAITEEVFSANDKLNYLEFDAVCNRLRETLTKEMEQLENDVTFLHCCLTDALDNPSGHADSPALTREPTLTDLKEERTLLEKELLSTESLPNTPTVNRPPFQPAASAHHAIAKPALGPVSSSAKPALGPVSSSAKPALGPVSSSAKLRPAQTTAATPTPAAAGGSSRPMPLKASHHLHHPPSSASSPHTGSSSDPAKEDSSSHAPAGCVSAGAAPRILSQRSVSGPGGGKGYPTPTPPPPPQVPGKTTHAGKRAGSTSAVAQSRLHSASARVKVVPVGRVHEPRADSASSRSFITPTPPSPPPFPPVEGEQKSTSRPSSAQRFRSMVMSFRESM